MAEQDETKEQRIKNFSYFDNEILDKHWDTYAMKTDYPVLVRAPFMRDWIRYLRPSDYGLIFLGACGAGLAGYMAGPRGVRMEGVKLGFFLGTISTTSLSAQRVAQRLQGYYPNAREVELFRKRYEQERAEDLQKERAAQLRL
ncbi:hypothetical protein NDN08_002331 [Rhodosorus marinus]|uniref:NADH-ubiquinone oxidoreductase 21kDa subunit N-terminal domain-containing protein n=1 Tax=Rhodosorus marinus TaxID=101924 RepID=A0AAV8UTE0_9RHOD|nr:hypothetical protein NDN08_002331 [Rhodosorus marinus]